MHKLGLKKLLNTLLLILAVFILGLISKDSANSQIKITPSAHADEPAPPAPAGDPGCGGSGSGEGCEGCGGCP